MIKKYSVSGIIPAFNEEKKIKGVLKVLVKCPYLNEVICINDGSTDQTLKKIKEVPGVKLFNFKKNHGKSYAIVYGIKKAKGEILVFIDADLEGLTNRHIHQLIQPLESGKFVAAVGYCAHTILDGFFRPLSGERAYFKKDLIENLNHLQNEGYGLELRLNYLYRHQKVAIVKLKGLKHTLKHHKQPYNLVAQLFLREGQDILSQIIKQKNPIEYLARSYFHPFYFKKPAIFQKHFKKLIKAMKKIQKEVGKLD